LYTGSWLQSFDEDSLPDGSKGVSLQFMQGGQPTQVQARAIVLAMPKRSLELLAHKGPVMDPFRSPRMRYLMDSVEPADLYKMFLAYERPWWEKVFVTQGRSLTDTPIRQCYYWGVEGRQVGANPNNTNALLMCYNDLSSSEYWGGLRRRPLGPGDAVRWSVPGNQLVKQALNKEGGYERKSIPHAQRERHSDWGKQLRKNWDDHVAPHKMVSEMHRQLKLMHGLEDAPAPLDAAFIDWSDDPYGGAVHFWNPGYKTWEVLQEMTQPVPSFPCYVCGEAYSTNQTWVEGALQTAEIVLQKHFKLTMPKWYSNG
jgi:hypothetical protein